MTKKFKNFVKATAAFVLSFVLLLPIAGCDLLLDIFHTHYFTEWETVRDSNCVEKGLKERTCLDCGYVETEVIPEKSVNGSHEYSEWDITESDCIHTGEKTRTCSVCGDVDTQEIPALSTNGEHSYGEWTTTKQNDCGHDGEKERTCTVCGDTQTEVIPATNEHNYGEWNTTKENHCGNDGEKERTCSVCGDKQIEVIPAVGEHVYGEWQDTRQNDCGHDGEKQRICSNCNHVETEVIPATGEHQFGKDGICSVCGQTDGSGNDVIAGDEAGAKSSELSIHFLELGNKYTGDCTLIKCGNTEILIDAGSRKDSAATIKKYVDQYCTDGILEYVIATHAHQDHIAGFVGNSSGNSKTGILYQYKIGTIIQFAGTGSNTQIYKDYCTAVEYAKNKGTAVYTAKQCWYETDGAKKQYYLDENQKISMNILYNYYYEHSTNDENDYSVCMLLTQQAPDNTYNYLFTGDLEEKGESYLVEYNTLPEVELFKGGHHGSYTASTEKLLSVIKPKNVAVCCCCGTTEYTPNIQNTFPAQAFINRVAKYTQNIYCTTLIEDYSAGKFTSMNGNIVFYSKYDRLYLWCSNNNTILKDTEWFKANRVWNGI